MSRSQDCGRAGAPPSPVGPPVLGPSSSRRPAVTPGLVDIHSHADLSLLVNSAAEGRVNREYPGPAGLSSPAPSVSSQIATGGA